MDSAPHSSREPGGASPRDPLDQLFGDDAATHARKMRSTVGRQLFEYVLEQPSAGTAPTAGRILIVDHDKLSRPILARNLRRDGYAVEGEDDGARALVRLEQEPFDLVLWEVELPGLRGPDLLAWLKQHATLQHLPVVLLSEQKNIETVIRCLEAGADDYLPKPFNPALLKARIRGSMERKRLRDQEQKLLATIQAQQQRIDHELAEASAYLQSLLPAPQAEPFRIDWRFAPSSELGGDAFGYYWIDDDHFALYLLDVCGHGVGAALLSVSVLNALRSGAFPEIDFRRPGDVLGAANRAFPMERQNNSYFTLWYGVYRRSTRELTYASGGHPPALLFGPDVIPGPGATEPQKLATKGMIVGGMPDITYSAKTCAVAPGSRLFLFCDGAYEITRPDGTVYTLEEFAQLLGKLPTTVTVDLDNLYGTIRAVRGPQPLEDDFTVVAIQF